MYEYSVLNHGLCPLNMFVALPSVYLGSWLLTDSASTSIHHRCKKPHEDFGQHWDVVQRMDATPRKGLDLGHRGAGLIRGSDGEQSAVPSLNMALNTLELSSQDPSDRCDHLGFKCICDDYMMHAPALAWLRAHQRRQNLGIPVPTNYFQAVMNIIFDERNHLSD
jgi:hypothetical protein